MISIEKCKEVLNKGNNRYSDSQVKQIRELLYTLADIEMTQIESNFTNKQGRVVDINMFDSQLLKAA